MKKLLLISTLLIVLTTCFCLVACGECKHEGGTATCIRQAVCTKCNLPYGPFSDTNHVAYTEATCTTPDSCSACLYQGKVNETNHADRLVWDKTSTTHKQYCDNCKAVIVQEEPHTWQANACLVCKTPSPIEYTMSQDGTYAIVTDYTGTDTEVVIPSTYQGVAVTVIDSFAFARCASLISIVIPDSIMSINDKAFYDCASLTSVTIGNNVTMIRSDAFRGCTSLTSIEIPDSVITIWGDAFWGCTSLTSITLGNGVIEIGANAFWGCTSLTNIIVDTDNPQYCSIDGNLYNKDGTMLVKYLKAKQDTTFVLPESVVRVNSEAFFGCTSLISVTLGNRVEHISSSMFTDCTSLTSIVIPDSVTYIDSNAFSGCTSLTSIVIPNSVKTIGNSAFARCTSLTSIEIPDSVTSIGFSAFRGCTSLTSIEIPDSVTSISSNAFSGCTSLTSIVIPNSVKTIGNSAFARCTSLTSIVIPDSVVSIDDSIIFECPGRTIYCKATSEPSGWEGHWTGNSLVYWYSENQPTTTGNYWHYVNGVPTKWE